MSMKVFLRGALLLPFFLMSFIYGASISPDTYYSVFYSNIQEYDKWLNSHKNDHFKDIFIAAYNLPSKGRRKFSFNPDMRIIESYTKDEKYGYIYLEFKTRTNVEMIVSGIKKGTLTINGSKRGDISLEKDSDYVLIHGVFEKGIYFFSLNIIEKFENIPVAALSNRKLSLSKNRGFNRAASANVKVSNIKSSFPGGVFSQLYGGFCFPFDESNPGSRKSFHKLWKKNDTAIKDNSRLIKMLFRASENSNSAETLKKLGFSHDQLSWWQEKFNMNEVCKYGKDRH